MNFSRAFSTLLSLISVQLILAQTNPKVITPQVAFDFKQASEMLNTGTAQLKGSVYYDTRPPLLNLGNKGELVYARMGVFVTLYPLTTYLEEYLKLKKKNKRGKTLAAISREANSFRLETKIYSQTGQFTFFGLKPGKYYIETMVHFPSGIGGYDVAEIVEIKQEGETLDVKFKANGL